MREKLLTKILIAVALFLILQMAFWGRRMAEMGDNKMSLEAEIDMLTRKRDGLHQKIAELEREEHRMQLKFDKLDLQ
jgi:cell division protein FtsL